MPRRFDALEHPVPARSYAELLAHGTSISSRTSSSAGSGSGACSSRPPAQRQCRDDHRRLIEFEAVRDFLHQDAGGEGFKDVPASTTASLRESMESQAADELVTTLRAVSGRSARLARSHRAEESVRFLIHPIMHERNNLLLQFLKVPPEPHVPAGSPGSAKVFRAAPNFWNQKLLLWALHQASGLIGIMVFLMVFWFGPVGKKVPTGVGLAVDIAGTGWCRDVFLQLPFTSCWCASTTSCALVHRDGPQSGDPRWRVEHPRIDADLCQHPANHRAAGTVAATARYLRPGSDDRGWRWRWPVVDTAASMVGENPCTAAISTASTTRRRSAP